MEMQGMTLMIYKNIFLKQQSYSSITICQKQIRRRQIKIKFFLQSIGGLVQNINQWLPLSWNRPLKTRISIKHTMRMLNQLFGFQYQELPLSDDDDKRVTLQFKNYKLSPSITTLSPLTINFIDSPTKFINTSSQQNIECQEVLRLVLKGELDYSKYIIGKDYKKAKMKQDPSKIIHYCLFLIRSTYPSQSLYRILRIYDIIIRCNVWYGIIINIYDEYLHVKLPAQLNKNIFECQNHIIIQGFDHAFPISLNPTYFPYNQTIYYQFQRSIYYSIASAYQTYKNIYHTCQKILGLSDDQIYIQRRKLHFVDKPIRYNYLKPIQSIQLKFLSATNKFDWGKHINISVRENIVEVHITQKLYYNQFKNMKITQAHLLLYSCTGKSRKSLIHLTTKKIYQDYMLQFVINDPIKIDQYEYDLALQIADTIIILKTGKFIFQGLIIHQSQILYPLWQSETEQRLRIQINKMIQTQSVFNILIFGITDLGKSSYIKHVLKMLNQLFDLQYSYFPMEAQSQYKVTTKFQKFQLRSKNKNYSKFRINLIDSPAITTRVNLENNQIKDSLKFCYEAMELVINGELDYRQLIFGQQVDLKKAKQTQNQNNIIHHCLLFLSQYSLLPDIHRQTRNICDKMIESNISYGTIINKMDHYLSDKILSFDDLIKMKQQYQMYDSTGSFTISLAPKYFPSNQLIYEEFQNSICYSFTQAYKNKMRSVQKERYDLGNKIQIKNLQNRILFKLGIQKQFSYGQYKDINIIYLYLYQMKLSASKPLIELTTRISNLNQINFIINKTLQYQMYRYEMVFQIKSQFIKVKTGNIITRGQIDIYDQCFYPRTQLNYNRLKLKIQQIKSPINLNILVIGTVGERKSLYIKHTMRMLNQLFGFQYQELPLSDDDDKRVTLQFKNYKLSPSITTLSPLTINFIDSPTKFINTSSQQNIECQEVLRLVLKGELDYSKYIIGKDYKKAKMKQDPSKIIHYCLFLIRSTYPSQSLYRILRIYDIIIRCNVWYGIIINIYDEYLHVKLPAQLNKNIFECQNHIIIQGFDHAFPISLNPTYFPYNQTIYYQFQRSIYYSIASAYQTYKNIYHTCQKILGLSDDQIYIQRRKLHFLDKPIRYNYLKPIQSIQLKFLSATNKFDWGKHINISVRENIVEVHITQKLYYNQFKNMKITQAHLLLYSCTGKSRKSLIHLTTKKIYQDYMLQFVINDPIKIDQYEYDLALQIADTIIILKTGKFIFQGLIIHQSQILYPLWQSETEQRLRIQINKMIQTQSVFNILIFGITDLGKSSYIKHVLKMLNQLFDLQYSYFPMEAQSQYKVTTKFQKFQLRSKNKNYSKFRINLIDSPAITTRVNLENNQIKDSLKFCYEAMELVINGELDYRQLIFGQQVDLKKAKQTQNQNNIIHHCLLFLSQYSLLPDIHRQTRNICDKMIESNISYGTIINKMDHYLSDKILSFDDLIKIKQQYQMYYSTGSFTISLAPKYFPSNQLIYEEFQNSICYSFTQAYKNKIRLVKK